MNSFLEACRSVSEKKDTRKEIIHTLLILLFGFLLGVFSKGLEVIPYHDAYLSSRILEAVDLRNVFSRLSVWVLFALVIAIYSRRPLRASLNTFCFFLSMLCGYYLITVTAAGFFPKSYMIAWGIITLFTPLAAFFAWYAKGKGWFSVLLSAGILGFFFSEAFSFGLWYFDLTYLPELLFFAAAAGMLLRQKKQIFYTLLLTVIFAPFFQRLLPYIFGGL